MSKLVSWIINQVRRTDWLTFACVYAAVFSLL